MYSNVCVHCSPFWFNLLTGLDWRFITVALQKSHVRLQYISVGGEESVARAEIRFPQYIYTYIYIYTCNMYIHNELY